MKATKKQLKEIAKVEKKVAKVCDSKKTIEVTRNEDGNIVNKETGEPIFEVLDIGKKRNSTEVTRNDEGVIVNKETGKPHFDELYANIKLEKSPDGVIFNKETGEPYKDLDSLINSIEKEKQKKSRDISIALGFGKNAPSLKSQIEQQGFKISRGIINDAEQIRNDLHDLNECGILKQKELWKCFKRLSKKICKVIIDSEIKVGEIAVHKQTIIG
jgi:hypothetical protein